MRTENTVRNEKRGMISHMRTKKRSIAGIAILVYFLIAVLVVIILKFPDADKITDDSGDVAAEMCIRDRDITAAAGWDVIHISASGRL